jgi:phage portal protein BeeE
VPKLWKTLLGRSEVARYNVDQYASDLQSAFYGGQLLGGSSSWQRTEDLETPFSGYIQQIYKANGPIFAIILSRMLLFTEAVFCWWEIGENGDLGLPAGRAGLAPLERPWPNAGTAELLARMEQDVSLGGNFYAAREENRIRRLRPDWTTIVLNKPPAEATECDVEGYWYHPGRHYTAVDNPSPTDTFYPVGEACHWSPIPDPDALYRGMSWLQPIVNEVSADKAATMHKKKFFDNGATLGTVIAAKENLTKKQFDVWRDTILAQHQGVDRAYKPLFLASPVDVTVQGVSLNQLDFKVSQGSGETRLCAAGGVPPIIVGLSEGLASATYSNYASARRKFGDHWARPQWRSAAFALSAVVDEPREDVRLGVNTAGIAFLREDQKDAAEIQQIKQVTIRGYVEAGFTKASAIAAVDADDRSLLVDSGLVSVQLLPPGTEAGITDAEEDVPAAARAEVERANQLKEYWLRGEGLARWATWTQLYNHLREHVGDERAKRIAAEWYHERYGRWPGHQKGDNPTGPG